jgi:Fe2+ or Zn2+ uptake regulation protein
MTTMAMNVRLTEEAERVLTALAEEDGVSKNEEINRAILDRGARLSRDKDVRALGRAAMKEYGPLLDRLAQ